jgi:hypothetical protein
MRPVRARTVTTWTWPSTWRYDLSWGSNTKALSSARSFPSLSGVHGFISISLHIAIVVTLPVGIRGTCQCNVQQDFSLIVRHRRNALHLVYMPHSGIPARSACMYTMNMAEFEPNLRGKGNVTRICVMRFVVWDDDSSPNRQIARSRSTRFRSRSSKLGRHRDNSKSNITSTLTFLLPKSAKRYYHLFYLKDAPTTFL